MGKGNSSGMGDLKAQGVAALVLVTIAIFAVLGMVVLGQLGDAVPDQTATINTTIVAFTAALALFGTFSSITALIIAIKVVISVVKGLR